MKKKYK